MFLFQGITCFTCNNSTSNENCNRVAIDRPCLGHYDTCLTVHVMETRGSRDHQDADTLSVVKSCSQRQECLQVHGCVTEHGGQRVCRCGYFGNIQSRDFDTCHVYFRSCCDSSYCNEDVPHKSEDINTDFLLSSSNTISKISLSIIVMSVPCLFLKS